MLWEHDDVFNNPAVAVWMPMPMARAVPIA
jgi:hypothetical protein